MHMKEELEGGGNFFLVFFCVCVCVCARMRTSSPSIEISDNGVFCGGTPSETPRFYSTQVAIPPYDTETVAGVGRMISEETPKIG